MAVLGDSGLMIQTVRVYTADLRLAVLGDSGLMIQTVRVYTAGQFLMLRLFGIAIAVAGLILSCFARGENRTAQRRLGEVLSKAPTQAQQAGGTFALTLQMTPKHGLRPTTADPIGVLPHSPATPASKIKTLDANRNISTVARKSLTLKSITIL